MQGEHTLTEPSITERLSNFGQSVDAGLMSMQGNSTSEYQGTSGMMEFSEDLGKASTYVKVGGAIIVVGGVVTAQPEIVAGGVAVYDVGGLWTMFQLV